MSKVLFFNFDVISIRIQRYSIGHKRSFVHEVLPFIMKHVNPIEQIHVMEHRMAVVNICVYLDDLHFYRIVINVDVNQDFD